MFSNIFTGKPKVTEIRNQTTWKVSKSKISGSIVCDAISGSAAPLFYKPKFMPEWLIPLKDDWEEGNQGYNASTNGTSVYISNIDCSRTNLLPIYCTVSEQSMISDRSSGFFPSKIC